ncbi:proton-conducting transporter membrane subunit [Leptospira ilyithenensis]|uniref:Formate hydrogenase n=1 Tax=Leptospira ilyithenensis TaxID=2484901 RepID=A0A4R9LU96_9LEPT|nr:proton-conducting transporter membrane subunit [Leptospira ilyithenensis]TGN14384.1 formate hydrogenase [Leptospira ilyithenensis]
MEVNRKFSLLSFILVGLSALLPLVIFLQSGANPLGDDFPILLGLMLQVYIGLSAFMLVQSYETDNKGKVAVGYAIFWASLGVCYLAGKSILLPVALEIASFSTILIYSGTEFGKKQIESLGSLLLASGISAIFLAAWVFLPTGDTRGLVFLTIALLLKSGFSGFHIWLPKVNEGGPSHALGAFAGALEIFPLLLFCRYVMPYWEDPILYQVLFPLAALGVFFGGITSFFHKDPKKALAYSSIESINFLWLCLSIAGMFQSAEDQDLIFLSKSFHLLFFISLLNHSFSKTFQLFSVGLVARLRNSSSTDDMKGIGRYIGISPLWMGLGTFSYAVIPGTIGFISESTYLFLNAKILDMPLGRSVFLLPAMIFIFFGIILGGFTHIRLYMSLFLSNPDPNTRLPEWNSTKRFWVLASVGSLGLMIFLLPILLPFILMLPPLAPYVDESFREWITSLALVSGVTLAFILSLVAFKWAHKINKRKFWDCGNGYLGFELSIPASVFSEPLRNSLGRYFLTKEGRSIIDQNFLDGFHKLLDMGKYFVSKEEQEDHEISKYLAISSIFLIAILSLLILGNWGKI